ncbi:MAG TPA: vitamin K epoxide reductase family protein [Gaiellaceae bacterium]|jgi:uncharacterized membrane protein|nr:vitamin K epoxide reductase family protein [Gaiellaceae bacterium]
MTERSLRIATGALALVGAGIAGYLTLARFSGVTLACTTGGCETVQSSAYAELLGVPVALLGLGGYAAILATALVAGELARLAGAVLALAGVAFGAYLLLVQVAVIGALCQWCLASDAVMALLAVAAVGRLAPESVAALVSRLARPTAGQAASR